MDYLFHIVTFVVAAAAILTATRTPKDDKLGEVLNFLTMNLSKAGIRPTCDKRCGPAWRPGYCDPDCPCAPVPDDHPWKQLMGKPEPEPILPTPNRRAAIAHTKKKNERELSQV